jgi:hypothetical protein
VLIRVFSWIVLLSSNLGHYHNFLGLERSVVIKLTAGNRILVR